MEDTLLKEYAALRRQREAIEEQEKQLKAKIEERFQEEGIQKLHTPFGNFTISRGRPSWKYSEKLQGKLEKLKIAQFDEQEKGIAEKVEGTSYLQFKAPKDDL